MFSSQVIRRLGLCGALSLVTALSWAWADPQDKPAEPVSDFAPQAASPAVPAKATPAPAKSSRVMFEANWKNVQVAAKPLLFRQGEKSFIWTVTNTGQNPVMVGDDYGFSIEPGGEDFIVDTRLSLTAVDGKPTTVDVNASRVMTQSELTQEAQPTPAGGPTYVPFQQFGPSANVPSFPPPSAPTPDPFGPATPAPKPGRKPEPTIN